MTDEFEEHSSSDDATSYYYRQRTLAGIGRDIRAAKEALLEMENAVLIEATRSLAEAAQILERVAKELRGTRPAEWMSHQEAAEYLRCTPEALRKLAVEEGLPRHRISAARYRYSAREIDEWLDER
jgi:excisionase family DNA binding protein